MVILRQIFFGRWLRQKYILSKALSHHLQKALGKKSPKTPPFAIPLLNFDGSTQSLDPSFQNPSADQIPVPLLQPWHLNYDPWQNGQSLFPLFYTNPNPLRQNLFCKARQMTQAITLS